MSKKMTILAVVAVMAALALTTGQAIAQTTLVVDDGGVDCTGTSPPVVYPTIDAAVTAASSGNTIRVCPGTYTEQVNVNKSVTVTGIGWPVVNATVNGFAITGVGAAGATVEGFEINQSTSGGAISVFDADSVTIRNNRVNGAGPFTSWQVPPPWAGISVILSDYVTLEGNYVHNTTGAGIWWGSSNDGTIRDNHVVSTQYTGILLPPWSGNPPSSYNVIEGNRVNSAGNTNWVHDDGIRLAAGAHNNTVQYNHVSGSVSSGIRAVGTTKTGAPTKDNLIQFNMMRGNGGPSGKGFDAYDQSSGTGTAGTDNTWTGNKCRTDKPDGLC